MNISFIAASSLGKDSRVFRFRCSVKFRDSIAFVVYGLIPKQIFSV